MKFKNKADKKEIKVYMEFIKSAGKIRERTDGGEETNTLLARANDSKTQKDMGN